MRSTIVPTGTVTFAPARNMRAKWRTVAVRSAAGPTMKPGVSQRSSTGSSKRVAQLQEAGGLVGGLGVDRPAEMGGVVGDHPQRAALQAGQRGHHARAPSAAQLEHRALVEELLHDVADLVAALALLGHQGRAAALGPGALRPSTGPRK